MSEELEKEENWFDFNDIKKSKRKDGYLKKQYRHWCKKCKKDRGYAFKNKIIKEPLCLSCKMKEEDVLIKIKSRTYKVSQETKNKISNGLYRRYGTDSIHRKIAINLRSRLNKALKGCYKTGSAVYELGCSINDFKRYLESKWQPGMSWDNYGIYGWHIDHIKPLVSFNLNDPKQFKQACHYTNLQPLWAKDNLEKRKYDGTF